MTLRSFLLLLLLSIFLGAGAQPKTYQCNLSKGEIIIDGDLDDWKDVEWTDDFVDITGNQELAPKYRTRIKMLWDSNYLYVAAEMEDPHLWATITQRDKVIYYDNDFEIFIDPDGDTHNYAEIEVNAFGTIWDLFLTRPYRDGTTPLNSFNIDGLLCEVNLDGSINQPGDKDIGWTVEMAIPWDALTDLSPGKRKPYPGEYWRINFSRVHWDLEVKDGLYVKVDQPEYNWVWSEQGDVNMHMPEKWGYVFFSDRKAEKNLPPPPLPFEEHIRHILRQLYYTQKHIKRNHGAYSAEIKEVDTNSLILLHLPGKIYISASDDQYQITYIDPKNTKWLINQHGRIWKEKNIKFWVWMHGNDGLSDSAWLKRFQKLKQFGISGVLLGGSNELLERIIPMARENNIEVQAWRWMLNCNNKDVIDQHPEWYSVSREGYSCLEKQPYVGYYKWLCPSRKEVRVYLNNRVEETMETEGLAGFHMDYIRHPDVILPRALWEKYGLIQDHEMPEYDYCYCDVCRNNFKSMHGYDPHDIENPENDSLWRQYRYDIVTECVNIIFEKKISQKKLSAAVFPSPDIARSLVRQDWDKWHLDEVFPMVYHNFYNKDLEWIGETTWAGVHALNDRIPVYTGLYIPSLSPKEMDKAIRIAIDAGAYGVALFEYSALTDEHWELLQKRIKSFK